MALNPMALIQRVQDILLKPRETWPRIAAESSSEAAIYRDYLMPLAAVPALAAFIGLSLVGIGGPGGHFRLPLLSGLVNLVLSYLLSLALVFVMARVVDTLAPGFGGQKSPLQALKLVAYSITAALVGGIFSLLPALSVLGLLAGLYSIYLLYLGLPLLMHCPANKAMPYCAVVVLCGIVAGAVLGAIAALLVPGLGMAGALG